LNGASKQRHLLLLRVTILWNQAGLGFHRGKPIFFKAELGAIQVIRALFEPNPSPTQALRRITSRATAGK